MLEWYVFISNFNTRKIETYNIFDHYRFFEDCKKNAKKNIHDYDNFCKTLKRDLMYYFWSKCEWEIILNDWPTSGKCEEKIDVYDQIKINWKTFCDYVWSHGAELRRKTKNK